MVVLAAALAAGSSACSGGGGTSDAAVDVTDITLQGDSADAGALDGGGDAAADGDGAAALPGLAATTVSTRFVTREHMIASFEMQQSGEPFAEAMVPARNLAGFDRNALPPNLYTDPTVADAGAPVVDLVGFASAIESYEYSKQSMNNLALEGGAGTSLAFAPIVNPTGATGPAALALLRTRVQHYALGSHVGVTGATRGYVLVPPPASDANNVLGWRGLWPTAQPFRSFDPAIMPVSGVSGSCSITPGDGDDGRAGATASPVGDYECDYVSLHLPMRATQVESVITPGASGWAAWKFSLWITNYLQIMHDTLGNSIGEVPDGMLAAVGSEANTIVGTTAPPVGDPGPGMPGTYLGSSDIEGFQASIMIDELDNAAQQWLTQLNTTDGAALSGFASVNAALAYDYNSPLRWIPGAIGVTETSDTSGFPRPTAYAVTDGGSHLLDQLGLLGAYSQLFSLTDRGNTDVGGTQPTQAYFDGDPFPADNQLADGEATLHDRALALLKVTFVNVDRMHRSSSGILVDDVTLTGGTPTAGTRLSTTTAAYAMVALRALRRGLSSNLTLYSNSTPDTAVTHTALDATSMAGAPMGQTLAQRITALIQSHADLLLNRLTDATGSAFPGWDTATSAVVPGAADLDSHAAAVRGLLEGFLATGDTRYRDRALAVFNHMDATLYDTTLRVYRLTPGGDGEMRFTPMRFALLQSALRETYKLVGTLPGNDALGTRLLDRVARHDKLVLNGWDDRNNNGVVDWPGECVSVVGGLPRGGLQMAERALTGELGLEGRTPTSDRDHDCVPEVSYARVSASLAAEVQFTRRP